MKHIHRPDPRPDPKLSVHSDIFEEFLGVLLL